MTLTKTKQKTEILSTLAIFRDATAREMADLNRVTTLSHVSKGHIFYYPDDISEVIHILLKGRVQLYRINIDGKKIITTTLHPQMLFDEASLLGDGIHQSFAEAIEPSRVLKIGRAELKRLMLQNPGITMCVFEHTCSRLQFVEQKLESVAFKGIAARVSEFLLDSSSEQGSTQVIGFTHQDIAESIGTYRETTTQVLNDLKSRGYISIQRKRINILAPTELAALV